MTDDLLVLLGTSLGIQAVFFVFAAAFRTDKVTCTLSNEVRLFGVFDKRQF